MSMPFESTVSDATEIVSQPAESDFKTDFGGSCTSHARFFELYAPNATRYAMSILRRWADAEEVAQEAFCKIIEKDTAASEKSNPFLKALLFTTVKNLSIDRLRKRGRRKFEPFDEQQLSGVSTSGPATNLLKLESGIESMLEELPDQWSEALRLKLNGDLSYADIADVMSATPSQVRTWIFRARKKLRDELNRSGLLE